VHNNYYFLRKLSAELGNKISNAVVSECFSQNKDELIIRFETKEKPFFIKASLQSTFCCLSFPEDFNRARKNSVDLFSPLIGLRVEKVTQFTNERSFLIEFSDQYKLLFKMHGVRANLVLFKNEEATELFRNHLTTDATINLTELDREIDWSFEAFEQNINDLPRLYYTFGKPVWSFLVRENFESKSPVDKWVTIQDLIKYSQNPTYYVTEINSKLILTLFADGEILKKYSNAIQAANEFFHYYTKSYSLTKEKNKILTSLKSKLTSSSSYLKKAFQKKIEIEKDDHYKIWADLLMANLHQVKPGTETITLPDFYQSNKQIEIKLKKDISPQKNAEIFYRKSKNQQIEIQKLSEGIASKQKEVATLTEKLNTIEEADDVKTLRSLSESFGLKQEAERKEKPLPYHEVEFHGFKIWIGKNAQHNDTLTLKHTFKDDLWLHAKDVAGSHVVIKYQSGKPFPKEVIERAAQLAAYHSKRKTDTLCPVAYTSKKFVRKRKGDPAGAVVVEREDVILVEPTGI